MISKNNVIKSVKLAWPISLQNILVTMLSMIDVIMVSHLGEAAVGAVGLGNRIQFVVMVIILGLAWGVSILAAQYFGAGKLSKVRNYIAIAIVMSFLFLLPIFIANVFFVDSALALGTDNQSVIELAQTYLWITIPSLVFVAVVQVFENALRSMNQVKLPMILSAAAITLNIVLNYWLINGGLGIPALGVEGAAWATSLSRLFQMLLLLYCLKVIRHQLLITRNDLSLLKDKQAWLKLIKIALPLMFSFGVWSVGSVTYQFIYGRMGTSELAVLSMLTPIEGVFISIFFGFASACGILIGQELGANRFDKAWQLAKSFSFLSPLFAMAFGLIAWQFQTQVLSVYSGMSEQTLTLAKWVYTIFCLGAWLKITNMTLAMGMLRAGGDNKYCLYTDTACMWFISIPLVWLGAFYWQLALPLVVLLSYAEEIGKALSFGWRVRSKKWIKNLTQS